MVQQALVNHMLHVHFQGMQPVLEEECYVKDALSRIVVEMVKREWPQHWPDMLKEMEALTAMGVYQAFYTPRGMLFIGTGLIITLQAPTREQNDFFGHQPYL